MWRDFKSHPRCHAQAFAEENLQTHGDQTPGEERFDLNLCFFSFLFFFCGSRSIPQPLPVSVCVCVFDLAVGVVTPMPFCALLAQVLSPSLVPASHKAESLSNHRVHGPSYTKFWGARPPEANASYNYLSEVDVFRVLQVMFQRRS